MKARYLCDIACVYQLGNRFTVILQQLATFQGQFIISWMIVAVILCLCKGSQNVKKSCYASLLAVFLSTRKYQIKRVHKRKQNLCAIIFKIVHKFPPDLADGCSNQCHNNFYIAYIYSKISLCLLSLFSIQIFPLSRKHGYLTNYCCMCKAVYLLHLLRLGVVFVCF